MNYKWTAILVMGIALAATAVIAQVPTIGDTKVKDTDSIGASAVGPGTEVAAGITIPANRIFVLTDLIVTNDHDTQSTLFQIKRGTGGAAVAINTMGAGPFAVVSHSFHTGIEFLPGEDVVMRNHGGGGSLYFAIRGYFRKP